MKYVILFGIFAEKMMHPNLSTIGVNKTLDQTNFCNSLCDNKLETLGGSKKTWIPTCPLGKQLSHFSCLGLLLILLILLNDFVRGWLVWALTLWASEHNCEDHSSFDFTSAVLFYDLFQIHYFVTFYLFHGNIIINT